MERGSFISYIIVGIISGIIGGGLIFGLLGYYQIGPKAGEISIPPQSSGGEGGKIEIVGSEEDIIIHAYNTVAPSVVHITSTIFRENIFMEVFPHEGVGSGVIVSSDGYILTNNHVIEDAESIEVILPDGKEYEASLVGADPRSDLAVVKIDAEGEKLKVASLGDSDSLKVGMRAMAIGNPFRLDRTITVGVVSALNRTLRTGDGYIILHVIQTDASINPGNSGGPLINSQGEVIGINTAIFSTTGGSQGVGFAVPINTAKRVMKELIEKGRVSYPWMGISGRTLTEEIRESLDLKVSEGVLIAKVVPGSPADEAGLKKNDVITHIDGQKVNSIEGLIEHLLEHEVGDEMEVNYVRENEERSVKIILGEGS